MSEDQSPLAIEALITGRLRELKLSPVELVRRSGYKNVDKGLRRLDAVRAGYFDGQEHLLRGLPDALRVLPEKVQEAIEDTRRYLHEEKEAAWRAAFVPHAIIITERDRPTQIFVAFFIGINRLLRVDFEQDFSPESFVAQALAGIRKKLAEWKSPGLPTFGRPLGVVVNYSPDHAVHYDLAGNEIEVFNKAYRLGEISFSISRRPVSEEQARALFKVQPGAGSGYGPNPVFARKLQPAPAQSASPRVSRRRR